MFNLFQKSPKSKIGLDITPEGITMVLIKNQDNKNSLQNYIYMPFQKQTNLGEQIENFEVLTENLKSIINEYKFETRETVISVPSNQVFLKKITLPDIPEQELQLIAPQEASKHLPISSRELNVDFQILQNTKRQDDTGKKVDVVLCALAKDIARRYMEAISEAGLHVNAIDISSFAMIKALANAELINDPEKTYVSVLVDYAHTDINIIQNGMPMFSHNIQTGKKNIIENITNSLLKKKEEVLKLLPEVGLLVPGAEMNENPDLNKASNAVKSVYSNIAGEIQKTIEFFNSDKEQPVEIESIIIGGNGICVQNIDRYLFNKLRIETQIFNPFTNISEEIQNQENLFSPVNISSFTTSIGLALKELEN